MEQNQVSGKSIALWVGAALLLTIVLVVVFKLLGSNVPPPSTGTVDENLPPVAARDHVRGATATSSKGTLIEYSDFQCPACEYYYPIVEQTLSQEPNITYIYRHFPLSQHPNALPAARAAEAASNQGKFWDMYHLLFQNHSDWTELSNPQSVFEGYATKLKLDLARFRSDYASSETNATVQSDYQGGVQAGVDSTPSFFLNGIKLQNPSSADQFKQEIDAATASTT